MRNQRSNEFSSVNETSMKELIKQLTSIQLSTLLNYTAQWNTNTRTSDLAQSVLNIVLNAVPPNELLKLPDIDNIVKALLPYTYRHFDRLLNLRKNTSHLDYIFSCMRLY